MKIFVVKSKLMCYNNLEVIAVLKETVLNAISDLPESFPVDEVMYRLYILSNHEKAMRAIEEGDVYSMDEAREIIMKKYMVSK